MQFANINGITLHYQVISAPDDKPTLVFSNSLGTDFRIWRDVIVRFVGDCSLVLYDKRGHGLSDAPPAPYTMQDHADDLIGLMDHLGLSDAIVCGLSVGGLIAQTVLHDRPDLVRALILCNTAAKLGTDAMWNERIAQVEEGGMDAITDGVMEKWFTPHFRSERATDTAGYRNMVARIPVDGYIGTSMAIRDTDLRQKALDIKVPAIAISGDQDGSVPHEVVLSTAKLIPDCRYEMLKNCGHIPCVEQPEMLVEIIKAFMVDAELA